MNMAIKSIIKTKELKEALYLVNLPLNSFEMTCNDIQAYRIRYFYRCFVRSRQQTTQLLGGGGTTHLMRLFVSNQRYGSVSEEDRF